MSMFQHSCTHLGINGEYLMSYNSLRQNGGNAKNASNQTRLRENKIYETVTTATSGHYPERKKPVTFKHAVGGKHKTKRKIYIHLVQGQIVHTS